MVVYYSNNMAKLSRGDVLKLAKLAKLSLTPEEVELYREEISEILGYVELLQNVEVDDLIPTYQVTGLKNVTRPDEAIDYKIKREDLLKNVPEVEDGQIKVKRVLG